MIIVLMGVSGSGKSTLGRALSAALGWEFVEGDAYHPPANVEKMRRGQPLDDDDRMPWLDSLNSYLRERQRRSLNAIVACSALKQSYRSRLANGLVDTEFVYLYGSSELIRRRLQLRDDHFMPGALLDSQMAALEPPDEAVMVDIALTTALQADTVIRALRLQQKTGDNQHSEPLVEGLAFPEAPRWHQGRLWFTDQHASAVYAVSPDGVLDLIARTDDLPGGLGWQADGTPLIVYMTRRQIMRLDHGRLVPFADLAAHASFHCNDMLVDQTGRAYVGNFGYDLHGGAPIGPAELLLVSPDGGIEVAAEDLIFPNGCALSPDGHTLLVAETFAHRITAFDVDSNGRLDNRRTWADLDPHTPDGICLDAEGALWIASPGTRALLHVNAGGAVIGGCETLGTPYACMLGGADRRTLYICSSETDDPERAARQRSGRIEQVRVATPGAGLP